MSQLGKYQLVAEIARGGMGIVYLAVAQGPARFSKLLVIKELRPEFAGDPSFLEMFLEEARLSARLSHPNIVPTYEVGQDGNRYFIVMDYLDGVTLARVPRSSPDFTLQMRLRVLCELLAGLEYAHTLKGFDGSPLGLVHRDVTPQNVFLTFDGQVKLVDFGIAKGPDSGVETLAGTLKGKPAYMAPEQLATETQVDARADIFSVGMLLWESIAGRRMWQKRSDVEIITAVLSNRLPPLAEAAPGAPPELVQICDRALAVNRDERYPSAAALRTVLETYLQRTGAYVSMRSIGDAVAHLFEEERAARRAMIDMHLNRLRSGAEPERVPSLKPPPADSTSGVSGSFREPVASAAGFTPAGAEFSLNRTPDAKERRRGGLVLALAAAALLVVATVTGLSQRQGNVANHAVAAATAAPTPEPAPPPPATQDNAVGPLPGVTNAAPIAPTAPTEKATLLAGAIKPQPQSRPLVRPAPRPTPQRSTTPEQPATVGAAAAPTAPPGSSKPTASVPSTKPTSVVTIVDDGHRVRLVDE